jgi:hypothetical protein
MTQRGRLTALQSAVLDRFFSAERVLEANAKDGGCTPGTLSFLLRSWRISDGAKVPAGYTASEIRAFKDSLAERLAAAAFPA